MTRQPLLHDLFALHAQRRPDAVAVLDGSAATTASQLDCQADQLAGKLRARGIGPGSRVGLRLAAGAGLVAALLGVWRAGGTMVRLGRPGTEPAAPACDLILSDTGDPAGAAPVLGVSATTQGAAPLETPVPGGPAPSGVAWLFATQDDGTHAITYAMAVRQASWLLSEGIVTPADRLVLPATDALDGRLWAVAAALVCGAPLVVLPTGTGVDGPALAGAMRAAGITVDALTDRAARAPHWMSVPLRAVVVDGLPDEPEQAQQAHLFAADTEVWRTYGISVLGAAVAAHRADAAREPGLGVPVAPELAVVIDEFGEPVPPGIPGELAARTGEMTGSTLLLPDVHGPEDGLLYPTGLLVRQRADDSLDFLGPVAAQEWDGLAFADHDRPEYVAPRTAPERLVAQVWGELLETDAIGAHDDFFQLGGYSLQLAELAARLGRETGRTLELSDLYAAVTVEEQAALLAAAAEGTPPVTPVERGGPLPLSFGQRRLWFLDRMYPNSPEWVVPLILRIPAALAEDTVRRALDLLAVRHEPLRTRYASRDGAPVQLVEAPAPVELRVVERPPDDGREEIARAFDIGFDLESGKVWRALLVRRGAEDATLIITIHHIACDGWSATLLEREFRAICAEVESGGEPSSAVPSPQYADYAVWQRTWRDKERLAPQLDYWRRELAGVATLDLPADRPRPAERDPRGGLVPVRIPACTAKALTALGQGHQATPFMTLLTAYATLLARHSGQWDVAVGVPVAGRTRAETDRMIGFFLNSLVLRCRLDAALPFTESLDRVRRTTLDGFAHQDVSFESLVEDLRPERDPSRTPLYQVAFNFNDDEVGGGMPGEEDSDLLLRHRRVAKTDLTLYLRRETDGSFAGVLEYATRLFDHETVERLGHGFVRLLESAAERPETGVGELEILSERECAELADHRGGETRSWDDSTLLDLFERQAAATPDATAIVAGGTRLSYREVDERANRIGHHLAATGVGDDTVVGVCLERGPDLILALLGVWKAGAAYLPLDPTNPADRLAHALRDSSAGVLLTDSMAQGGVRDFAGERVEFDRDAAALAARPTTRPDRTADPELLAYVIYTSGSTGTPKGVMITHCGLANHLRWAQEDLTGAEGGAPLFSSVAFDLPATNLFAPLITGRAVHVLPAGDLTGLGTALADGGPYAFVKVTPGHLGILGDQLTDAQAARLAGTVVVAGEELPGRLADRWLALLGPGRLLNEYGPTETSIGTLVHAVRERHQGTVPLGRPLPRTSAVILDGVGRPVPIGVVGELYIGGAGVARGYLGRPALTAERFVPDPDGAPGSRRYRTGDLARRRRDGAIEFLGRVDRQVKVRGYRVELGEIEARLSELAGVRDAVVVVSEHRPGERVLAAYVVPDAGETDPGTAPGASGGFDPEALRGRLAAVLPDYMVPSSFTVIAAVPLTANGKLDRGALPDAAPGDTLYTPPANVVEERVAALFGEVLAVERIGADAHFFHLGGHSILAIRLTARLQEEFDLDLSVRTVFEEPTVRQLARAVEAAVRAEIAQMSDAELMAAPRTAGDREA
ncbi:amino acid adenylation domain-containing protein (plasmid) [Streptomyces sp. NBC_00963]|uniref:amino acid adenylation domain-containing protein n=1 Tax=Streptomyces sp. NBC_00963 TaxID=2903697 RepID=UPI002F912E8F|nr:amino acid adenylation domain-containing protein [Streptomyces sp. NBC_00963]